MRVAVFSTKPYDEFYLQEANRQQHELLFLEARLSPATAALASGFEAVCAFVNDQLDREVLQSLASSGVRYVALRCAGFNNVDLSAAAALNLQVVRVPVYSPFAVAEHTVGLMLTLNRKIHRAHWRVREGNFALHGLLGFDMNGRTAGIVGTGEIGSVVAKILTGFGCRLLGFDRMENPKCRELGVEYVSFEQLLAESDIVTLHCPLTRETHHMICKPAIERMKPGVMLINTSRGALVDAQAATDGLKSGKIGYLGLDVYEEEAELFFEDHSGHVIQDDVFMRLATFPNVLITAHQAFFTATALEEIARVTMANLTCFERGEPTANDLIPRR